MPREGRRAGQHGDEFATRGRPDELHRAEHEGPRGQREQRPLRQPDGSDRHDADDHPDDDDGIRGDHVAR